MIKLFAFDLDGTLLKENQEIDCETLEFIKNLDDIRYIIVTGRNLALVEGIISKYELDCDLILNNGHEFYSKDKKEHKAYPFSDTKIKNVIRILLEQDFHLSIHSANGNKYIFMSQEDYYNKHIEMSAKVRNTDIDKLLSSPLFSREAYLKNTVVLNSIDELDGLNILKVDAKKVDKESNKIVLEKLKALENISLSSSYEAYIEVCDSTMDKGKLLLEVADEYGIKPHEIASFGDSDNDMELLKAVPHSFAMGNGKEELKKIAKFITNSNDEQGVLNGMKFILEKENSINV